MAGELLDEAERLMDDQGRVERMDRFDALLAEARLEIERAQNEALDVYGQTGRAARHAETLGRHRRPHNEQRRQKAAPINARLIALDDEIARQWPNLSQYQRAKRILSDHGPALPEVLRNVQAESLAKRIRNARK